MFCNSNKKYYLNESNCIFYGIVFNDFLGIMVYAGGVLILYTPRGSYFASFPKYTQAINVERNCHVRKGGHNYWFY